MNRLFNYLWITLIIVIVIIAFFYLNPLGIKWGYNFLGGNKNEENNEVLDDAAVLMMEYEKYVKAYEMYCGSDNATQKGWAESAKKKANRIAEEYNEIMNEEILRLIGDW